MRRPSLVLWLALAGCGVADTTDPATGETEQAVSQCGSAFVEGLDVFDGQGAIDWAAVQQSGRAFAFIKATQGDYNHQKRFAENWAGAGSAGLMRSAYHFFDPTIDGTAQAQSFLAALGSAGGMTASDLPAMLDIECPVSSSQSTSKSAGPNCEYTGNSGWVAPATMKQRIFDWITAVTAATGRAPIVYSYPSWFAGVGFQDPALAQLPLFIATYSTCANVPTPWTSAVFWQYSATGTVPGVTGKLDVDRFFGSAGDLATWTAATLPDAGVPPMPDAGSAAEQPDAGTLSGAAPAGCGCGASAPGASGVLLAALCAVSVARRRRFTARAGSPRPPRARPR